MIEADIAQWLADNTAGFSGDEEYLKLILGTNLWLNQPPAVQREGTSVNFMYEVNNYGEFKESSMAVLIVFKDYVQAKTAAEQYSDIIFSRKLGYNGDDWSVAGSVAIKNYGIDDFDRYVFALNFNVIH